MARRILRGNQTVSIFMSVMKIYHSSSDSDCEISNAENSESKTGMTSGSSN
jgi:hypothetical protein